MEDKEEEIKSLKSQLQGMNLILEQNAALEREVAKLCHQLDEVTMGIQKRGYLYKWREREISFASKWMMRYVVLQKNILSYYADDKDSRPLRTINLDNCEVRDEGTKKNGQFRVFSVYLHSSMDNVSNLVIRMSTDSPSEADLWMDALKRACNFNNESDNLSLEHSVSEAHDDPKPEDSSSQYDVDNGSIDDQQSTRDESEPGSPLRIDAVAANSLASPSTNQSNSEPMSPIFNSENASRYFPPSVVKRVLSSSRILQKSMSRTSLAAKQFFSISPSKSRDNLQSQSKDGGVKAPANVIRRSFPASKPIHVAPKYSPLSSEMRPGEINYRGRSPFLQRHRPQFFLSIVSWTLSISAAYGIEILAHRRLVSNRWILGFHVALGILNILGPCLWVWNSVSEPIPCMIYLFQSVVIWMKLISYAHVNTDLRGCWRLSKMESESNDSTNAKPKFDNILSEIQGLEPPYLSYPQNLTISNLLYFIVAPTLCYQINYPRSPKIRWEYIATIILRIFGVSGLSIFVIEQYIKPTLLSSVVAMRNKNALEIFMRLLKLSIPSTYVWLLGFYLYFHLWLNLLAELTRFGDREFYRDWWNARTVEIYWRLWNLPVHSWMLRHLYYPLLRTKIKKSAATIIVFAFSALFHEVVISTPFRYFALHAFFGMLAQAPLIMITKAIDKRFDNAFVGNAIFWCVFCVIGQPMGVIMYYYDIYKMSQP